MHVFSGLLIAISIVFILVAIIIIATATSTSGKTAGWMMFGLFVIVGGYAGYLVARKKKKQLFGIF